MRIVLTLSCFAFLLACASQQSTHAIQTPSIKPLPYPVSNHAVAQTTYQGEAQYFVFNGLTGDKTHADITKQAWVYRNHHWQPMSVPENQPAVLASVAATVNDQVYLFGGYTVAADDAEKSSPLVWQIDGSTLEWRAMPPMPTPVDDSVALVYQNRYIYLISGWHDVDNVDLVQVFDTEAQSWQQATAFPLPAVFGHAGGIVGNQMVVCDGVKVIWESEIKKRFEASPECALGTIDNQDITKIHWQDIPHHSGTAFYRMAAASDDKSQFFFIGGSDNPYNYNGIGYDGQPSPASADVRIFDLNIKQWNKLKNTLPLNMDHRGLLKTQNGYVILAGMRSKQSLSSDVIHFENNSLKPNN